MTTLTLSRVRSSGAGARTRRGLRAVAIVLGITLVAGFLAVVVPTITAPPAKAADLGGFDPGLLITDDIFFNGTAMNASQIESFIRSKDPDCQTHTTGGVKYTCLADYSMKTTTRKADAQCATYTGKSSENAATIIARVAAACRINPEVILVTLQKEQSFLTGGARSSSIYRKAMGYGCPDSSVCDSKYYGLFNQVYSAAWQFQYYKNNPSHYSIRAGQTNSIKYNPNSKCGTAKVYIRSQATAGLYIYTPYVPNAAALAAGTGTGDSCSSYGNRNFFNYFTSYFGNPANRLHNPGFESNPGTKYWTHGSQGGATLSSYASSSSAHSGKKYLRLITSKAGALAKQTLSYKTAVNGIYQGAIWMRASAANTTVNGTLQLWAVGGSTEKVSVPFSLTDTWTDVTANLTVMKPGHTQVRFIVELDTPKQYLRMDDATFFYDSTYVPPQVPMTTNGLVDPGFEQGASTQPWVPGDGSSATYEAYKSAAYAHSGNYYLRMITPTAGDRIKQTVIHTTAVGESYTASVWVKAATTGATVSGHLQLYAAGGTMESVSLPFTVGNTWEQVNATLPITTAGHTELRYVVQVDTPNQYLRIDDTDLRLTPAQ